MKTEDMNADIHHALSLAVLALTGARNAVEIRSTPDQCAQMKELIEKGAQPTLAVRIDAAGVAHIEFVLIPADHQKFFDNAMLRFDGPAIAALAEPGSVETYNRAKLN